MNHIDKRDRYSYSLKVTAQYIIEVHSYVPQKSKIHTYRLRQDFFSIQYFSRETLTAHLLLGNKIFIIQMILDLVNQPIVTSYLMNKIFAAGY